MIDVYQMPWTERGIILSWVFKCGAAADPAPRGDQEKVCREVPDAKAEIWRGEQVFPG